jgi:hypothetical protein
MEVTKLERDTSLKLLYKSLNLTPLADSAEAQVAAKIVEFSDHLPLSIDQAAYIREVRNGVQRLPHCEYRDLSNWEPQGIRQYPHTVATTWDMSFMAISSNDPTAVELLRLLSFLNPDGILIKFLQSGANGIQENLQQIILHRIKSTKSFL